MKKKSHLYNGVAKDKEEMKGRQSESSARKMKKTHSVNDGANPRASTSRRRNGVEMKQREMWSGGDAADLFFF